MLLACSIKDSTYYEDKIRREAITHECCLLLSHQPDAD